MKLFGLIGYPLGHSFSKKYFTQKFEKEGLSDCVFDIFPLEIISQFPHLLQSQPQLNGLAVTIPYKESIIQYLDLLDDEAEKIGAVNCIRFCNGKLKGYNTDVTGFELSFKNLLQANHQKALVLGTGGAAKAITYVLNKLTISFLQVSRTPNVQKGIIGYEDITASIMNTHTIIINCTPVGMSPAVDLRPAIPYQYLTAQHLLYDLVYQPATTLFLSAGIEKGAVVKNGYDMLAIQAEDNWRIWNESCAPF